MTDIVSVDLGAPYAPLGDHTVGIHPADPLYAVRVDGKPVTMPFDAEVTQWTRIPGYPIETRRGLNVLTVQFRTVED